MDVMKEVETRVVELQVEPVPEKSLSPTLSHTPSPHNSPHNSPQISPQVTGESENVSTHGTGKKWHLLPSPAIPRYPKRFPVPRPPFAPERTQHRVAFVFVGDIPEEDTFNIRTVQLRGADRPDNADPALD